MSTPLIASVPSSATLSSYVSPSTQSAVRPDGRWHGRVTRNDLPELGEVDLSPERRRHIASIWLGQAATEARVAGSFAVVHDALAALGANAGLVRLAARAVDDEHRHAALCEHVAGQYFGSTVGPYTPLPPHYPHHPGAPDAVRHALHVIGQCCLNETFASAYLSVAQKGATTPLVKQATRELLSDEIDHARIGWAFVHSLPEHTRAGVQDWLLALTVCNLREWRSIDLPAGDELAAHGIPPWQPTQDAITETLIGVVIPGFQHVGLDTRKLERWAAEGAEIPPVG